MFEKIIKIDTFLTPPEISILTKEFTKSNWELTGSSNNDTIKYPYFWYKELINNKILNDMFKSKVERLTSLSLDAHRFYANGQTHGQCGGIHRDFELPGKQITMVYYCHENWLPIYGGHLLILDKKSNIIESIWPKTNSAVIFESNSLHVGLEPTCICKKMRISIAGKYTILSKSN